MGDFPRRTRAVARRGELLPDSEGRAEGAGGRWVPGVTQQRGPRPRLPARRRGVHVSNRHMEGSLPLAASVSSKVFTDILLRLLDSGLGRFRRAGLPAARPLRLVQVPVLLLGLSTCQRSGAFINSI